MGQGGGSDGLGGLVPLLRVRPQLQSLCRFGAQWAVDHEAEKDLWAPFHIVARGACTLDLIDLKQTLDLEEGDVAVLPHGARHVVRGRTTPRGAGPFKVRAYDTQAITIKTNVECNVETELVCGRLRFETTSEPFILSALPDAIVVATADGPDAGRLRQLMNAIKEELEADRPAASAIATDLASALFVMVVRAYLDREQAANGLLSLLAHKQAARAVEAMLGDLAKPWTLDELAESAHVSRASLVRIFNRLANLAPMEMLAELRLEFAMRKLSATDLPMAEIAAEIGYQSESAFSRAFRRRFGRPPGDVRLARQN
jgi:AraC family transcriptional regulator, activator of mtrCDE